MSNTHNPQSSGSEEARLTRLEENAAFAERSVEELAAEVRLLNTRIRELSQRVAAAEARVGKVEASTAGESSDSDDPA